MSVEFAILFPFAGLIAAVVIFACAALMIHYMYPRQRQTAGLDVRMSSIWVETIPEREGAPRETSASPGAREFVQIRRLRN